ncbi:hypothetical protein B0H13DRAFT_2319985 [Mycena leptocephala]|nr:hypothetical protein B0H13DRAFT_2319985 [Mycena leptocephala]
MRGLCARVRLWVTVLALVGALFCAPQRGARLCPFLHSSVLVTALVYARPCARQRRARARSFVRSLAPFLRSSAPHQLLRLLALHLCNLLPELVSFAPVHTGYAAPVCACPLAYTVTRVHVGALHSSRARVRSSALRLCVLLPALVCARNALICAAPVHGCTRLCAHVCSLAPRPCMRSSSQCDEAMHIHCHSNICWYVPCGLAVCGPFRARLRTYWHPSVPAFAPVRLYLRRFLRSYMFVDDASPTHGTRHRIVLRPIALVNVRPHGGASGLSARQFRPCAALTSVGYETHTSWSSLPLLAGVFDIKSSHCPAVSLPHKSFVVQSGTDLHVVNAWKAEIEVDGVPLKYEDDLNTIRFPNVVGRASSGQSRL